VPGRWSAKAVVFTSWITIKFDNEIPVFSFVIICRHSRQAWNLLINNHAKFEKPFLAYFFSNHHTRSHISSKTVGSIDKLNLFIQDIINRGAVFVNLHKYCADLGPNV
jgi:hypothetical protein